MDIASLYGISFGNPYNSGVKANGLKGDATFSVTGNGTDGDRAPANSAPRNFISGKTVAGPATANTLWQTQSIAQSGQSSAIDVEESPSSTYDSASAKSAADKFKEFMNKSPEEMMRDGILKELGYTEDRLASMPPAERKAAEEKISALIEQKIEQSMHKKGLDVSITQQPDLSLESIAV